MDFWQKTARRPAVLFLLALALAMLAKPGLSVSDTNPFDTLLGTWGGNGQIRFDNGSTERLRCDAYYTGGGSQLGMAIRCSSDTHEIEMRSKLSYSGGRVTGSWEERTFNAHGTANGRATDNRISLEFSGGVSGTMVVSYDRSHQDVAISAEGLAMQGVRISLSRR